MNYCRWHAAASLGNLLRQHHLQIGTYCEPCVVNSHAFIDGAAEVDQKY